MTAEAKSQPSILDYLEQPKVRAGLGAVAGKYLNADRMLRLCVNAVKKTPLLLRCDPQTVLGAMMASAALGLEPNTVQQQAFLIPYKRRVKVGPKSNDWADAYDCQFQIGARGFVTLAYRSPRVRSIVAEAIREGDKFEHMLGSNAFLSHTKALRDRGEVVGAYSFVRLENGLETACVLPLEEIEKIRQRSETYRALVARVDTASSEADRNRAARQLEETPWVMWIDDMAAKSAIKKHAKQLPIASGDALAVASHFDSEAAAGDVDLSAMTDPDFVREVMDGEADPPALTNERSQNLNDMGIGAQAKPAIRTPVARSQSEPRDAAAPVDGQAKPVASTGAKAKPVPANAGDQGDDSLLATDGEKAFVRNKLNEIGVSVEDACNAVGIGDFEKLSPDGFIAMRDFIAERSR